MFEKLLSAAIMICCIEGPLTAQPIIYNDAQTLITGTWNGNGTLSEVTTNMPYEGTHHYQFAYSFTGYWAGFGLDMDNWGNSGPINLSGYTHLHLAFRGLSGTGTMSVQLRHNSDFGNNYEFGYPVGTYTVVDIPIAALTTGTNVSASAVTEIDFSVGGAQTGSGTVYLDDVRMINASNPPSPASAATWARTGSIHKGVNMSNWLEAYWLIPYGTYPQTNVYTYAKVSALRNAGFDVFRLPVIFERLGSTTPPYNLDFSNPAFALVDSAIHWASVFNFKLIIDNHHGYDLTNANFQSEIPRLRAVWKQLTQRYTYLNPDQYFFEVFNEPTNEINNLNFATVAANMVDEIRLNQTQNFTVIVGATSWNSGTELLSFVPLSDPDILYTFHDYDPFLFTHQGFSWTSPPYFPARTFPQAGEVTAIQQSMAAVKTWSDTYSVPVLLGEFGVSTQADATSRCNWISTMISTIQTNGFPYIYWDAISPTDAFGFYTGGIIDQAHVIPCFSSAMNLYAPLPLALEQFGVRCVQDETELNWKAVESGSTYAFQIENSVDGIVWNQVGTIQGMTGEHNYARQSIETGRYFRLKICDAGGGCTYSKVVESACNTQETVEAFPNPASDLLNVKSMKQGLLHIRLVDATGRILVDYLADGLETSVTIPISGWPAGAYIMEAGLNDGQRIRKPFLISR